MFTTLGWNQHSLQAIDVIAKFTAVAEVNGVTFQPLHGRADVHAANGGLDDILNVSNSETVTGRFLTVYFKVQIISPELVSTQEELLLALKYKESFKDNPFPEITLGADRLFDSTRRKLELLDVPQHQIETLIKDRTISKTMHIHSPVNGFVIEAWRTDFETYLVLDLKY